LKEREKIAADDEETNFYLCCFLLIYNRSAMLR